MLYIEEYGGFLFTWFILMKLAILALGLVNRHCVFLLRNNTVEFAPQEESQH